MERALPLPLRHTRGRDDIIPLCGDRNRGVDDSNTDKDGKDNEVLEVPFLGGRGVHIALDPSLASTSCGD